MLRRKRAEIHVNQERWLVSYADFITLLFAFFVVMYSISQVNQSKYRVLSETFVHAFSAPGQPAADRALAAAESTLNPIQVGQPSLSPATSAIDVRSSEIGQVDSDIRDPFTEISELFAERFGDLINDKLITVSSNELWLQIEVKDSILFASGSAEPSLQAQVIFDEIALILKDYPNPVQVEGYTDNVPINSARYPSNWELSSARASAIVKWLASRDIAPTRLSAVGFGEFQPIADNASAEGRAQNRRVALMIARKSLPRPGMPVAQAPNAFDGTAAAADNVEADTGTPGADPETTAPVASQNGQNESVLLTPAIIPQPQVQPTEVTPVQLENGGLLFTSDPTLPRNDR